MRVFVEQQRFTQSWLIALMGVSIFVPTGIMVKELTKEDSSIDTVKFVIVLGSILICILPIFIIKLKTRIDEKGIHFQFFPFHLSEKTIAWAEIKSIRVRKYDPIGEYGGWGIKLSFRHGLGKAINVSGDIGIQLELNNGKPFLLGTQKQDEAKRVIANYQSKINQNEND